MVGINDTVFSGYKSQRTTEQKRVGEKKLGREPRTRREARGTGKYRRD